VTHAKRQALHMAVLTQVQLARRQYELAVKQFNRAATIQQVDRSISQHTANRQEEDAQSQLERIAANTSAIISQLRRYQTLAEVHAAIGRMQSTLGADLNIGDPRTTDLPTLIQQITTLLAAKETPLLPKPVADTLNQPVPPVT
jgi:hypothetical protein